jgi:malonate decarboxylase epsilon subunit
MTARLFPAGGGMVRVSGLPPERAKRLADGIGSVADPLWLAQVNSADESVFAGTGQALRALPERASEAGAHRVERLEGAAPCHGPALRPLAAALAHALIRLPDRRPAFPCAGNVTGRLLRTSSAVRADLALGVATTVRWHDATARLLASGVEPLMPTTIRV